MFGVCLTFHDKRLTYLLTYLHKTTHYHWFVNCKSTLIVNRRVCLCVILSIHIPQSFQNASYPAVLVWISWYFNTTYSHVECLRARSALQSIHTAERKWICGRGFLSV